MFILLNGWKISVLFTLIVIFLIIKSGDKKAIYAAGAMYLFDLITYYFANRCPEGGYACFVDALFFALVFMYVSLPGFIVSLGCFVFFVRYAFLYIFIDIVNAFIFILRLFGAKINYLTKERFKVKREDIKKVEAMSRKYVPNMSDPVNFIIDPELTRNYEYINWLYSFMVCKDKVTDDLNEYEASFLTDVEKRNIMKLHQFHALVLDYYIKNNINIYKVDYGNYVKLFYQNEGLELGSYTGQGSYTYCRKIPIDNINEFVNFENIVKSNNVVRIKK